MDWDLQGDGRQGRPDCLPRFQAEMAAGVVDRPDLRLGDHLCRAAATVLDVDGAAMSVFVGRDVCIPVGDSGDVAALAERVQFTSGESPCLQAYLSGRPVVVPDVRDPASRGHAVWPVYAALMSHRTRYVAVAAFPMTVIGSVLGVLSLFATRVMRDLDVDLVTLLVAVATRALLGGDSRMPTAHDPVLAWLDSPVAERRTVWRAQGIVMRAEGLDSRRALNVMRAQALASRRLVDEVAEDIVRGHRP